MSVETCADAVLVFRALRQCVNLIHVCGNMCQCCPCIFLPSGGVSTWSMSVETCADAVLVFPALSWCVNLICCLWKLVLISVLVFSCLQEVCEFDTCLWKLVLMLSLCFPALRGV